MSSIKIFFLLNETDFPLNTGNDSLIPIFLLIKNLIIFKILIIFSI